MKKSFLSTALLALLLLAGMACNNTQGRPATTNLTTETPIEPAPAMPAPDLDHSNKNVLDWQSRYAGTLPGSNGERIETTVFLKYSGHYVLTQRPAGSTATPTRQVGTLVWDAEEISVTLQPSGGGSPTAGPFMVGEEALLALDANGKRYTGAGAEKHQLAKSPVAIRGVQWNLVELNGKPVSASEQRPYFMLNEGSTKATGRGACNNFTATYEVRSSVYFTMKDVATTRMACAPGNIEGEFLSALQNAATYDFSDEDTLVLHPQEGRALAQFSRK